MLRIAVSDLSTAIKRWPLIGILGWQDIKQRYRRSALGPFWLTISMGVTIATIGIVFGQLFGTPMREFLPFLTIGLVLWALISTCITEGCMAFIDAQGVIRQLPIPLSTHALRVIWRNILIFCHNILIFPIVLIFTQKPLFWSALWSIPGFLLISICLTWVSLLLATLCARYRDLPQIITSTLQVLFYITPIIWMPNVLKEKSRLAVLEFNPIYHLLEIVRAPLLGQHPSLTNWIVSGSVAAGGWLLTILVYAKLKNRVAYWV